MEALKGGVSYYPDHWPEKDWERDMTLIKTSGLDLIRFGEFSWDWFEPEEGKFDFTNYDKFMALAAKTGLKVILCTPTAAAPPWLMHRYPDLLYLDQHGHRHNSGRHQINYNHPEAKRLARRAILTLAEHFNGHEALHAWQIDNEPTFGESADPNRCYDYSESTVSLFHQYLKDKYQDIETLNTLWQNGFWSKRYNSFEQIMPPARPGLPSLWLDWLLFRDQNVADFVHWQCRLLKSVNPDFIVGTNVPETGINCVMHAQDYWKQCEGLDYAGLDVYCYSPDPKSVRRILTYSSDIIRSAASASGTEFWVSETQAGPHIMPWPMEFVGGLWKPEFLKRCTDTFVGRGAKNVLYFLWRPTVGGQEFGLNGLVNFDGTPSERSEAIGSILSEARAMVPPEKPMVYMHFSRKSAILSRGFDVDNTWINALKGWHALFDDLGYEVRFLNDRQIESGMLQKGDLLILPYTTVLGDALDEALRKAQQNGVEMISGFATGFFNAYGCVHTGERKIAFGITPCAFDPEEIEAGGMTLPKVMRSFGKSIDAEAFLFDSAEKPLAYRKASVKTFCFDVGTAYLNSSAEVEAWIQKMIREALD